MLSKKHSKGQLLQREYYTRTAANYESVHVDGEGLHDLACSLVVSLSSHFGIQSILDIGSGTGRAIRRVSQSLPHIKVVGIEPVEALRKVGYANGIEQNRLTPGDAMSLDFPDSSFDLVCELGVLHHLPKSRQAVTEMLRVAKKAIFLSDSNRFGRGSILSKYAKLCFWKCGLWPIVDFVRTKGRGYSYSEGDGVYYSYSVFDDYGFIRSHCGTVTIFNLNGFGKNPVTGASHIGLFAIKGQSNY